ncbi:tetratricopeptide (TPR) repeat protein [Myroides gitamensis]|uniref:tetratricopeptide repeat protein n=1 Tax=Myroides odoratus TaxID=256 RepID=UPI00216A2F13|nr:tetratricopeptide repeat protein [Myroides odoratus]MCS4238821.1 tetratricopeptide (TPR) repeat protein [Myroides odoratus]MDH6602742.1 tetratricopeptide (TPR) repeat protein [Myroides gitamensis]
MKKVLLLIFSCCSLMSFGQTTYEKGMQKAMQEWQGGNSQGALAILERIADANPEDWIPAYYQVFIAITQGFQNPQDEAVEEKVMNNRFVIERWLAQGGEEWYVLQGMNETLDLMTDPMNKGMKQSGVIIKAYEKALELNPANPRALYSLASFYLNSSKFMKVDTTYCMSLLNKAIVQFDQQKSEVPFYPKWGKEWALKTQASFANQQETSNK